MLPVEFTVEGPPISYQSHNKQRLREWQESVAVAARALWGASPVSVEQACQVTILYCFWAGAARLDNDNLAKPILDALNGLILTDDRQVTDTIIRRVLLNDSTRLDDSPALLAAARQGDDFVFVRVEQAPVHERLP